MGLNLRAAKPKPRRMTRSAWVIAVIFVLVIGILWVIVFTLYRAEPVDSTLKKPPSPTNSGAVAVRITIHTFNPTTAHLGIDIVSVPGPELGKHFEETDQPVTLSLLGQSQFTSLETPSSLLFPTGQLEMNMVGNYASYPLDEWQGYLGVVAHSKDKDGDDVSLPVELEVTGGVNGWTYTNTEIGDDDGEMVTTFITMKRAGPTVVFTFMMIGAMMMIVVFVIAVAFVSFSNRRHAEYGQIGWFTALLFALVAVRNGLPGAPPIGAAIDIYVFLWLLTTILIALPLVVTAWLRQSRAKLTLEREEDDKRRAEEEAARQERAREREEREAERQEREKERRERERERQEVQEIKAHQDKE